VLVERYACAPVGGRVRSSLRPSVKRSYPPVPVYFWGVDKFSLKFRDWMEDRRMKAADVVGALFVSEQSVRNWRSAGVPPRRRPQLADWMAEVDAARQETAVDLLRIRPLVVETDPAEFHAWENAALQEGKTLTEWARRGLTKMASRRGFGGGCRSRQSSTPRSGCRRRQEPPEQP